MHVFFLPDLNYSNLQLGEEESKHCIRVLRLKKGDKVHLADGKGTHAVAVIDDDNPKKCSLNIVEKSNSPKDRNYFLHIVIAPTKNFDRMEWFIEKATEVGIDRISFIETHNSERNKVNIDRCEKIAISAMKQSKQWWLPKIENITKLERIKFSQTGLKLIAWCETSREQTLSNVLKQTNEQEITILIGPEGDFTADEVNHVKAIGFEAISLGTTILRTETAALFACMAVKTLK